MELLAALAARVKWETVVVSGEIACALAASLYMMYRKVGRDVLVLGGDRHTLVPISPLIQPRAWCSLRALLVYRLVVVAFYVVVQLYDIYHTRAKCMVFYTSWNFILQATYFAFAASRTYAAYKKSDAARQGVYEPLMEIDDEDDDGVSFLRAKTHVGTTRRGWHRLDLVLDVCLSTSVLISVVVWTILYPYAKQIGHTQILLNWVSYCQHGLNVLLLQLDFVATQHSVALDALPLVVAWPTVYCVFTWIVHGTIQHGFWPYPFMRLDTPWAPVWYGGLLFAHIAAFLAVLLLSKLKHRDRNAQ